MADPALVRIVVNGSELEAPICASLLDVLHAAGIPVPSLCHHPGLSPQGACRMCLVEVSRDGRPPKLTTACNHPILPGMEVTTDSPWVRRTRQGVMELLCALAPGSPEVAMLAAEHGVLDAPGFSRDAERCIRCGLCVRVCSEVVGAEALGWTGRGEHRRVATPFDDWTEQCIGCGACAAVCPTGAIHMEEEAVERFIARQGPDRLCRYALLGLSPGAVCSGSYQCWRCEVEQGFADGLAVHPAFLRAADPLPEVLVWQRSRTLTDTSSGAFAVSSSDASAASSSGACTGAFDDAGSPGEREGRP